ncbi:hypothetical protein DFH08DRAFT_812936 [Mycena albidolilacea]|uniref:Uncharacterized protein n=1 Tax=Mycena albidolilacea TaxID=1033008 RepID=A0AAD6ZUF8_9AGAR|nr:hypothetical protein DFH08DRAFT_812936 [Mycena albidolilacea]
MVVLGKASLKYDAIEGADTPGYFVPSKDPRIVRHQFGDHLLRYNPKLGEAARYMFPDLSQEYAATRPNTPVPSLIAEIADEMEEDGEELDKENKKYSGQAGPGVAHVPSISRSLPLLNALSLEDDTLPLVRWFPSEGWASFLEFRLRPMIYFVYAAVTHDFNLVGVKGVSGWDGFYSTALVISHWYCSEVADPGAEIGTLIPTELDYPAFDKHGQLLIPDQLIWSEQHIKLWILPKGPMHYFWVLPHIATAIF